MNDESKSVSTDLDTVCNDGCKKKEKKSDAKKKLEEAKKSDESWFTKFENALVSFKTKI